ncbi:hypothetical protein DL93DRAFT_2077778 [Clavulina sp. PMI_390]|nr:hypothetical protein DL93DRAFT_2077778 [Clavulina sp. PMI_390]
MLYPYLHGSAFLKRCGSKYLMRLATWRGFFTLPLHFKSNSRGRGLVFFTKFLLSSPERARCIRRLTLEVDPIKPQNREQAHWLAQEFHDQLRRILSMMTGVKHLHISFINSPESEDPGFAPIRIEPHLLPDTLPMINDGEDPSTSVWNLLVSWLPTVELESLDTWSVSFERLVTILRLCPSIISINFSPPKWDKPPPTLKLPPCKFVERVNRTQVCAPSSFEMTYHVLEACDSISSLTVGSPLHDSPKLGIWHRPFPALRIIHFADEETHNVELMLAGAPSLLPSLVAVSEGLGSPYRHDSFANRFHLIQGRVATIFELVPSLKTYIIFWKNDQYALKGDFSDFQDAIGMLEASFATIPLARGALRIINEYRLSCGDRWISWVFHRDTFGFWSFYQVDSGIVPGVTLLQREHFYLDTSAAVPSKGCLLFSGITTVNIAGPSRHHSYIFRPSATNHDDD